MKAINKLEASYEHDLATLPAGPERRRVNDDLFHLRVTRAMHGI